MLGNLPEELQKLIIFYLPYPDDEIRFKKYKSLRFQYLVITKELI